MLFRGSHNRCGTNDSCDGQVTNKMLHVNVGLPGTTVKLSLHQLCLLDGNRPQYLNEAWKLANDFYNVDLNGMVSLIYNSANV